MVKGCKYVSKALISKSLVYKKPPPGGFLIFVENMEN
jgi:hypothetical protein